MKRVVLVIFTITLLYAGLSARRQVPIERAIAQADILVAEFISRYDIPGLSIALAREGEVVFTKAYGLASIEKQIPLSTNHVFRIASVSKPITSVMIMSLVEEGRLNLDDLVFGQGGILANDYNVLDRNVSLITVRHLLEHSAGEEWSNQTRDPLVRSPGSTHEQLIQLILDTRPLRQAPGSNYNYSNIGFRILGRVIEKITDMSYEEYFQELTAPLAFEDFSIGTNLRSDGNHEVHYYPHTSFSPYNYPVASVDSSGGWITSPTEMVEFLLRVDGFDEPPDILENTTIEEMTRPSQNNRLYAKGWSVSPFNSWPVSPLNFWGHSGSLPGTASMVRRTDNNIAWAVFLNKRSSDGSFERELYRLMAQITRRLGR